MSQPTMKTYRSCGKRLGRENFNASRRREDGLDVTCRACVNQRRRALASRKQLGESSVNIVDAARRGQLDVVRAHASNDPRQLQVLLWKTVQDFHSIRKCPEHAEQVRFLVEKGAVPHWSMICEAARGGHQDLVDVLSDCGVETNIFMAAATGDEAKLTELLRANTHLAVEEFEGKTALHYCAASALGKTDEGRATALVRCAERLLKAGAAIDATTEYGGVDNVRPLQNVCWTGGNTQLARLLLEHGADPRGCLLFALGHFHRHSDGHYDIAEMLLEARVNVVQEGEAALGRFAAHGDAKAVHFLLQHGANPNVKSAEKWTPLHMAAERNTGIRVVQMLLEAGASINSKTDDGHTPLFVAQRNNKKRVAEFLETQNAEK